MGIVGIYFNYKQAEIIPKGPFGLNLLAWGFILFFIASMMTIIPLHLAIYKKEHPISTTLKRLKKKTITINGEHKTYADILYENHESLALSGVPYYKPDSRSGNYTASPLDSVFAEFNIWGIVNLVTRSPEGYEQQFWIFTDYGREVIQRLKPLATHKEGSQK